jgi:N-acetylglucosaminyldiphosphoundecaprenol N-acetyl-beta-D-mannosaminyltransferase
VDFFGLKLSIFDEDDLFLYLKEAVKNKSKKICYGYSFGIFPYLKKYPEIAVYSNRFDILLCDGRGLYMLAKLLGFKLKSDMAIPNFSWRLFSLADREKLSVLIIGSTTENNQAATRNARRLYPRATIYDGIDGGRFTPEDNEKTAAYINELKPDILFVGVSSPKKEKFVWEWKEKLDVSLIIPFGGAIDILSRKSKPIPKLIKKMALGALWRFVQEPRRLFRDSIIYPVNVFFRLIPSLLFNRYILKKSFSIPNYYDRSTRAPIS